MSGESAAECWARGAGGAVELPHNWTFTRAGPFVGYGGYDWHTTLWRDALGFSLQSSGTLRIVEGRWKLVILFHLFDGKVMRFSELERAIPAISQKMLTQQLRQLESDGVVFRKVYPVVPPRVEYRLTEWGQALCPALDALLTWADQREALQPGARVQPHLLRTRIAPAQHWGRDASACIATQLCTACEID